MAILRSFFLLRVFMVMALLAGSAVSAQPSNAVDDPALARLGDGFVSRQADVGDTTLHYVRGGEGPTVVLLHGFPQDWHAFSEVMPHLAERFTVVALDLRGIGGSEVTPGGYDAMTLAADVRGLVRKLGLGRVYVVGHDLGGNVAYAFARLYPAATRGAMLIEAPVPGVPPWDELESDPALWHIHFHQAPEIPELLLAGEQAAYFRAFFDGGLVNDAAISEAEGRRYARSYAAPGRLRAGMEMYRALPEAEAFNASRRGATRVPLTLVGAEQSFGPLLPSLAETLGGYGWSDVTTRVVAGSSHYLVDEKPAAVAALIEQQAARGGSR